MVSKSDKFRGSLVGAVVGDCFGEPFEDAESPQGHVATSILLSFFQKNMQKSDARGRLYVYPYTDDTAMARSVALSLLENNGYNAEDMAKKFTLEFFQPTPRGYGLDIGKVFHRLKSEKFANVYQPAKDQFNGSGSFGNGGAMRVSPVALFCYNSDLSEMIDIARQSTMLTHAHHHGYNGAILQCLAIHWILKNPQTDSFDATEFIDYLIDQMDRLEEVELSGRKELSVFSCRKSSSQADEDKKRKPYCAKLIAIKKLLKKKNLPTEEVAKVLGNDVTALNSVPIAIYAFLRGRELLTIFECDNPFVRTLFLSIYCGGDTDTIASMACSLAGAFYGIESIPETFSEKCEGIEFAMNLADRLSQVGGIQDS